MRCPLCDAGYKPVERSVYYGLEFPRTVRPKGNKKNGVLLSIVGKENMS